MEIKDRIRMIMEREKVPPRVFAETIGVQQSTLSHILNDRNKPSLEVVMKVHQKYDYVNLEWLLYGKGEMMVSEEGTSFSSSNHDYLPSLFDENPVNPSKEPTLPENRKETPLRNAENAPKEIVKQEIRYICQCICKVCFRFACTSFVLCQTHISTLFWKTDCCTEILLCHTTH